MLSELLSFLNRVNVAKIWQALVKVVSDQCGEEIGIEGGRVFGTCHMRLKKCGNSRVGVDPRILFWQAQDGGLEDWRVPGWQPVP